MKFSAHPEAGAATQKGPVKTLRSISKAISGARFLQREKYGPCETF